MTECKHEIEIASCGICRPRRPPERTFEDRGTIITASFDSDCHRCGGGIYEGDRMIVVDGEYLCADHIPAERDQDDPFG